MDGYFKIGFIAALFVLGFGMGWEVNGWRYKAQIAKTEVASVRAAQARQTVLNAASGSEIKLETNISSNYDNIVRENVKTTSATAYCKLPNAWLSDLNKLSAPTNTGGVSAKLHIP
jgi:hypothetical protein